MKRVLVIQFILPFMLLALILGSGLALAAQSVYTNGDNGKTITVKGGDTFTVRLPENPTTGYSWNLTVGSGLQVTKDQYVPNATNLIGSGGYHVWTVKAVKNGTYMISGIYKRPWEAVTGHEQKFSMTVKVTGSQAGSTFPSMDWASSFKPMFSMPDFKYNNSTFGMNFGDVFKNLPKFGMFGQH